MPKLLIATFVVLATAAAASCRRAPAPVPEVVALPAAALPDDPAAPAWRDAPEHAARLLLQDLVEPRLVTPSTPEVRVRALATSTEIAFRLEWPDATVDNRPGSGQFVDACAVQVPQAADANAPDPQMGQLGKGVQITYWRADWQATVDGRGVTVKDLFPNASIDHYPFEAPSLEAGSEARRRMALRYAPADAVGNRRGGARESAVEDLVAEGPGTLAPAHTTSSRGRGARTPTGWSVVITRPLPAGLSRETRTQVAFAVWEGSSDEAGARKMRSGWVGLSIGGEQ
ncbi:MAG: ethylbenzene dehydrogenase-related protein [Acidobacteriota bacterium]